MNFALFKTLLRTTLFDPRQGGKDVIALNWPVQSLWLLLMLTSVLLSLMMAALMQATPMPQDELGALMKTSPAYHSPLLFAVINWGQAVITVFVLYWVSQMFGGKGELRDMLAVMIWLQIVSLVLASALIILALLLAPVAALVMLLAFFWGLWATIGLVDAGGRFDNMFLAFGVCAVALVAFTVGMTLIAAVIGGIAAGGA